MEKRNGCSKSIQYIKEGNQIISKAETILDEFSRDIKYKYGKKDGTNFNYNLVDNNITTGLQPSERTLLESEITLQELTEALYRMKKGKTPGSNGFSVEFFRQFWSELGPFLFRAFVASLTQNQEFKSHREGIIK